MQSKLLPTLGGDFHILLRCKVLSKHPVPVLPPLRSHKSMGIGQCESSVRVTKTHSRVGEWEVRKAQCKDRSALAAELSAWEPCQHAPSFGPTRIQNRKTV